MSYYKLPFSFKALLAGNRQAILESDLHQSINQNIDSLLLSFKGKSRLDPVGFGNPILTYWGSNFQQLNQKALMIKLTHIIEESIRSYEKRLKDISVIMSVNQQPRSQANQLVIGITGKIRRNEQPYEYSRKFTLD